MLVSLGQTEVLEQLKGKGPAWGPPLHTGAISSLPPEGAGRRRGRKRHRPRPLPPCAYSPADGHHQLVQPQVPAPSPRPRARCANPGRKSRPRLWAL